ncbi:MAG: hypothetical protein ABI293_08405, partial [Rhodanobacter sp.]
RPASGRRGRMHLADEGVGTELVERTVAGDFFWPDTGHVINDGAANLLLVADLAITTHAAVNDLTRIKRTRWRADLATGRLPRHRHALHLNGGGHRQGIRRPSADAAQDGTAINLSSAAPPMSRKQQDCLNDFSMCEG